MFLTIILQEYRISQPYNSKVVVEKASQSGSMYDVLGKNNLALLLLVASVCTTLIRQMLAPLADFLEHLFEKNKIFSTFLLI